MAIRVYGSKLSTCTQRVLLVLVELDLQWELVDINMMKGEHKGEKHPFGRIPVLEDGGLRIFESKAISRYLVAKYAGSGSALLLPSIPDDLANFEQVASVEYSYFEPNVAALAYEKLFKKMMGHGDPDSARVQHLTSNLLEALDYYEHLLQNQDYLTGDKPSLVDLFHVPWLAFLPRLQLENAISTRKSLQAWWEKLEQRASWQEVQCYCAH